MVASVWGEIGTFQIELPHPFLPEEKTFYDSPLSVHKWLVTLIMYSDTMTKYITV